MQWISRDELKEKITNHEDFILVEVLEPEAYAQAHLPGAINVPVEEADFEQRIEQLAGDKSRTVVLYCKDEGSSASVLAAQRLEQCGFRKVCAYREGKRDWDRAGLYMEGRF